MSTPYVGEIKLVSFNYAPPGWAICDGQLLSISQNSEIFQLIGTTYGGDGLNTFGLPDFRGRFPMGVGQGSGANGIIGDVGGSTNVGLTVNNLPGHSHSVACNTTGGTQASPSGGFPAVESTGTSLNYAASGGGLMSAGVVGNTGQAVPVSILPPYSCVNFIIALTGTFPSRS